MDLPKRPSLFAAKRVRPTVTHELPIVQVDVPVPAMAEDKDDLEIIVRRVLSFMDDE
jgi:hypothetical protein